jgi:CDP-paratose 2-epimerase
MKILITGIAGFVGFNMAKYFRLHDPNIQIYGIDNLSRRGSEFNLTALKEMDCKVIFGDIRCKEDVDNLPYCHWIIDCAANPSVTAGIDSNVSALVNTNLIATLHILEKCRRDSCGLILLSTSRVYSINKLNAISFENNSTRMIPLPAQPIQGLSNLGISESFSTSSPVSLYGACKLSSEIMAIEYSKAFNFPLFINRCGVIAGPGQFGKIDQGIFSYWVYKYVLNEDLSYIGYQGSGKQVRDLLHPADLFHLLKSQMNKASLNLPQLFNIGGGSHASLSLLELTDLCNQKLGINKEINSKEENRPYDIPWYITDTSLASSVFNWRPTYTASIIIDEIINYAANNINILKAL